LLVRDNCDEDRRVGCFVAIEMGQGVTYALYPRRAQPEIPTEKA